ncbi:helix-turn-helix domain-containing protein [Klebsiella grimontii]|uniref:helix-turn-helix domain-containing protein n=1 Tax=Klebsiella grimontii TaxID=2058152 RepID=UPI0012B6E848|nr:helix-turn-helix transcriptional regulator [Klebsiella grimontii]
MQESKGRYRPFMTAAMLTCGKTQAQVAKEIGFENANNISLIKSGRAHLSIDKVIPFAKSVGAPPDEFMMMYLSERQPEVYDFIIKLKRENESMKKKLGITD